MKRRNMAPPVPPSARLPFRQPEVRSRTRPQVSDMLQIEAGSRSAADPFEAGAWHWDPSRFVMDDAGVASGRRPSLWIGRAIGV